jgi:hypothetical protein
VSSDKTDPERCCESCAHWVTSSIGARRGNCTVARVVFHEDMGSHVNDAIPLIVIGPDELEPVVDMSTHMAFGCNLHVRA